MITGKAAIKVKVHVGKIDSKHHHHLEAISETATVLELKQQASTHHPLWVVVVVCRIGLPTFRCHIPGYRCHTIRRTPSTPAQ